MKTLSNMQAALDAVSATNSNAKADYLCVLMTFLDELKQPKPNQLVLRSCREFILQMPLPSGEDFVLPAGTEWGNA